MFDWSVTQAALAAPSRTRFGFVAMGLDVFCWSMTCMMQCALDSITLLPVLCQHPSSEPCDARRIVGWSTSSRRQALEASLFTESLLVKPGKPPRNTDV